MKTTGGVGIVAIGGFLKTGVVSKVASFDFPYLHSTPGIFILKRQHHAGPMY